MRARAIILTAAVLLAAVPLFAAYDAFLKIDGVQGESTDAAHQGWIGVSSFSWGAVQRTALAAAAGQAPAQTSAVCARHDFVIMKKFDKSSPNLQRIAASGAPIAQLTLDIGGQRHLLQNVQIASFSPSSRAGDEKIEFKFLRCATHENADQGGPINYQKAGYLKIATSPALKIEYKENSNGMFSLGRTQGPIWVEEIHFNPPNQAVLKVREAANGVLVPAVRRAFQLQQQLTSLVLSAYQAGGTVTDKDHKMPTQTFSFQGVTITGVTNVGGLEQITLNFGKMDGPMIDFHNAFPK